jgi:succinate dehydrogenase / fumarate reductase iron-sulfur subunit
MSDVTMKVWRGDASGGQFEEYTLPKVDGEVVLDVIHRIQATQAGDLACRWNCKAGKCGSCSAEINGKPALMCMSRISEFEDGAPITVTPLRAFPIIRDLVSDVSFNYEMDEWTVDDQMALTEILRALNASRARPPFWETK